MAEKKTNNQMKKAKHNIPADISFQNDLIDAMDVAQLVNQSPTKIGLGFESRVEHLSFHSCLLHESMTLRLLNLNSFVFQEISTRKKLTNLCEWFNSRKDQLVQLLFCTIWVCTMNAYKWQ